MPRTARHGDRLAWPLEADQPRSPIGLRVSTETIVSPALVDLRFDRYRNAGRSETNPAIENRSDVMRQSALEIDRTEIREANRGIEFSSGHETPKMLIVDDDPSVVRLLADH